MKKILIFGLAGGAIVVLAAVLFVGYAERPVRAFSDELSTLAPDVEYSESVAAPRPEAGLEAEIASEAMESLRPVPPATALAPPPTAGAPSPTPPRVLARASRIFGAEAQFPPEGYLAYGILAFPGRATATTMDRHLMICDSFLTKISHVSELPNIPKSQQIVTVWPMQTTEDANVANSVSRSVTCDIAVARYGLALAQRRIDEANVAKPGAIGESRGPFLIAWNPAHAVGASDQPILVHDLSYVRSPEQADDAIRRWTRHIQAGPPNWGAPGTVESARLSLRNWADHHGPNALGVLASILPNK